MAGNKITREDLLDDKVLQIGGDYKKSIEEAIEANVQWENSFKGIKAAILDMSELEKQFKQVSNNKQFLEAKKRETRVRRQTNEQLREQERLAKALERAQAKFYSTQSSVNKELQKTRFETNQLNKEARDQAILTSKLATEYQKQDVRLRHIRNAYKDLAIRQQLHGDLTRKEVAEMRKLEKQAIKIDSALKRVDKAVGQSQRNVGNYRSALQGLTGQFRALIGAFGLVSGIYLFVNAVRDAFRRVRDFDKSMQNLAGVLRTTRDELQPLEKDIINIAGVSTKTSNEVAKLAESLATLGKSPEQISKLLKPVVDLGIGLEASSEEAGEFLIQMLNTFGASEDQALEFADTIATIRTSTSLDFERMRTSFQYLAPISKALNRDLAYTGSLVGILSDNGIKAQRAGRLLGSALQRLAAEGRTLNDALRDINEAQARGANELEVSAIATRELGTEAATLGLILAQNIDAIEDNAQAIRDSGGALDDLVNQQLESLDARLDLLTSSYERFVLSLENGNGRISQSFKFVVDAAAGFFDLLTELNKSQDEVINEATAKILGDQADRYKDLGDEANIYAEIDARLSKQRLENLKAQLEAQQAIYEENKKFGGFWYGFFFGGGKGEEDFHNAKEAIDEINKAIKRNEATLEAAERQLGTFVDTEEDADESTEKLTITIADKRKEISALQKALEEMDATDKEGIRTTQAKIKELQKELDALLGVEGGTKKATKAQKDYNAELIKFTEQTKIDTLKNISKDAAVDVEARINALEAATELELNLIDLIRDEKLKGVKEGSDQELLIVAQAEKQKRDLIIASDKQTEKIILDNLKKRAKAEQSIIETEMNKALAEENRRFEETKHQYDSLEDAVRAHEERVADIKKQYAIAAFEAQIASIENLLATEKFSAEERIELEKKVAKAKADLSNTTTDVQIEDGKKRVMSEEEVTREILRISEGLAQALTDILYNAAQARIQSYEDEIERSNEKFDKLLDNDELLEEERERLEQAKLNKQKEIERKIAQEKRRQAILDKALAAVQIGVNTAVNISKVAPNPILIALVAALGAAQLAAVASTPIPAYEKGTDYHPGGAALVGEKRAEVIQEPNKAPYVISKPTVLDLPKGTKVTPSIAEYEDMMRDSILASVDINNRKMNSFQASKTFDDKMVQKLDEVKKAVGSIKQNVIFRGKKAPDINFQLWRNNQTTWRT